MISFKFGSIVCLFIYIYIELFISIIFSTIFRNIKFFSNNLVKYNKIYIFKNLFFSLVINCLIFFFFTLKIYLNNLFFSFLLVYVYISKYINSYFENYLNFLNFNIIIFSFFFFFINNFIIFYLFIELYALIFYFFFLNINFKFKQLYLIQYKNSLLLYLFNNFLTSILYLFSVSYIITLYGTINFYELNFFNQTLINWKCYLIVLSFMIKLSLPGYHFLKIEIYKYLSLNNVILFSVISLYINFLFIIFLFNQNIILSIINIYRFSTLLILCIFFFFIHKIKLGNFQEFISYSGFATNSLIILNFLI